MMRVHLPSARAHVALLLSLLFLAVSCSTTGRRGRDAPRPPIAPPTTPPTPTGGDETDYEPRDLKPARLSEAMRERCLELDPLLQEIAAEFAVDPALMQAIVRIESGFKASARSKAGARGLMQLMPRTAKGLGCGNVWDPERNLRCGARLLRRYLDRFDGKLLYALAAYNGGPGYVRDEYEARRLPRNFHYVEKVLKMQSFFQRGGCDAE